MKKLILIIFFFSSIFIFAQENGQLIINECKVIWTKTVQKNYTIDELITKLRFTGNFENIYKEGNQVIAELKALPVNYKGAGFNDMNTAMYLSSSSISAIIILSNYESKIEVIAKNIVIEQTGNYLGVNAGIKNIEFYALNGCQFRKGFLKKDKPTIEYDLKEKIGIK